MESFRVFVEADVLQSGWAGLGSIPFGVNNLSGLPMPAMDIPSKNLSGRIRSIFYTMNPITIVLENGSVWKLTKEQWDYLLATGKEPREGRVVNMDMNLDGTIKSVSIA